MTDINWKRYRAIKMKALNASYENYVMCPVCQQKGTIKSMDCHHLIPKAAAPHLTYVASNLQFVHKDCHKKIHSFMGNTTTKTIKTGSPPLAKLLKKELLEKALELEGYFLAAEEDMFNKPARSYVSPARCPTWVKRWRRY